MAFKAHDLSRAAASRLRQRTQPSRTGRLPKQRPRALRVEGARVNDDDEAAALAYQEQCEAQQFFNEVKEREMAKVSEMIVSKFLRKEDFDEDRVLTIKGVKLEDVGNQGEQRWVVYFREADKGMVLNITSIRVLEGAYGDDSDGWIGKRVMVYVDPNVSFQGRVVGGLRLRAPKQRPAAPAPKATAEEFEDDTSIPF